MKEQVGHTGTVVSMTPQLTVVRIVSAAACASCHAAGLCGLSESREKLVEVPTDPYAAYGVGDEVEVILKGTMGLKAVWVAYFIPLLVLLSVTLVLIGLGVSEPVSGICGVGAVAVYYGLVWLLRDRLQNETIFTIKASQNNF